MEKLLDAIRATLAWLHKHIDATLLIAAAVEIPRWCSTFAAINEPLVIGAPLGALLAYSTSVAWKAYFDRTSRWGLLALNIVGLAIAIVVITPVLFALTDSHEVDMTQVLATNMRWGWSGLLAITTFMPIIQLAAANHARQGGGRVQADRLSQVVAPETESTAIEDHNEPAEASQIIESRASATEAEPAHTNTLIPAGQKLLKPAELDEKDIAIMEVVKAKGEATAYAISQATGISETTLRRNYNGKIAGKLPRLVEAGYLRNGGKLYKVGDHA